MGRTQPSTTPGRRRVVNAGLQICFGHVAFGVTRSRIRLSSNYTVLQWAASEFSPCNFEDFDDDSASRWGAGLGPKPRSGDSTGPFAGVRAARAGALRPST